MPWACGIEYMNLPLIPEDVFPAQQNIPRSAYHDSLNNDLDRIQFSVPDQESREANGS